MKMSKSDRDWLLNEETVIDIFIILILSIGITLTFINLN
jgi:hypothetical protein